MNLISALLDDYSYATVKDKDIYILNKEGWFEAGKTMEAVNEINDYAIRIGEHYNKKGKVFDKGSVCVDRMGVANVLHRYSRDIYGQKRLEFQINDLTVSDMPRGKILKDNLSEFGCKTSSSDPYFYRKIAYLFYWFSLIKPFHLDFSKVVDVTQLKMQMRFYFNEYITYAILNTATNAFKEGKTRYKLTIHDDKKQYRDFLYDLHYRDLSRSSLEFFLQKFCIPISVQ
jgi:hypothetical protein